MASMLFLLGIKRKSLSFIKVDAFVNEKHVYNSSITAYPVEDGATITDHIVPESIELSVDGIISNQSIYDLLPSFSRVQSAFDNLVYLRDSREPFAVVTGLKVYENMAIESIEFPRDAQSGKALVFSASLKQVKIVTSMLTVIPSSQLAGSASTVRQAQGAGDAGKTATTEIAEPDHTNFLDGIRADLGVTRQ